MVDAMDVNFEDFERKKRKRQISKRYLTKMGSCVYLSCLFSELRSLKCQNWLIFVFADESRKAVTVLEKRVSTSERSYLVYLEGNGLLGLNGLMVLSYH